MRSLALTAVAAIVLLLGSAPAAPAATRSCGSAGNFDDVYFMSKVQATNTSCVRARRVARAFVTVGGEPCDTQVRCSFRGWSCVTRGDDLSFLHHRCTHAAKVVRWRTESG